MRYLAIILLFTVTSVSAQIYHRDPCPPSGGLTYTVDSFTSNGTWTKPANLSYVYVFLAPGGSGGKGGRRGAAGTNRGGGGAYTSGHLLVKIPASALNSTETVVVGAGGAGGAGATADNTNGATGSAGGNTYIRSTSFLRISSLVNSAGGSTGLFNRSDASTDAANQIGGIIAAPLGATCLGITSPTATSRSFDEANYYYWRSPASAGGNINSSNVKTNSGTLSGFYSDDTYTLTGEQSGVGEGVNGGTPTTGYALGEYLNRFLSWLDPADIPGELGRGGIGGGPGDTAGTVAGGNGGVGRGYGAGGGGGGASTNGANAGNGGDGNDGIVIFINVFE